MKRLFGFCVGVSILLVAVAGAPTALAAETHHGTFSGGTGYNDGSGQEGYEAGSYSLSPEGVWNLSIGSNSVEITGVLRNPTCPLEPCKFVMNLSAGTPWHEYASTDTSRTFNSFVDWGLVTFDVYFTYFDSGSVTLDFDIAGCPHGWTYWSITG